MPKATSAPIRAIGAPTGPQRKKRIFVLDRDLGLRTRELFESWIALLKPLELPFSFLFLGIPVERARLFCGFYTYGRCIFLADLLDHTKTRGGRPTKGIEYGAGLGTRDSCLFVSGAFLG